MKKCEVFVNASFSKASTGSQSFKKKNKKKKQISFLLHFDSFRGGGLCIHSSCFHPDVWRRRAREEEAAAGVDICEPS